MSLCLLLQSRLTESAQWHESCKRCGNFVITVAHSPSLHACPSLPPPLSPPCRCARREQALLPQPAELGGERDDRGGGSHGGEGRATRGVARMQRACSVPFQQWQQPQQGQHVASRHVRMGRCCHWHARRCSPRSLHLPYLSTSQRRRACTPSQVPTTWCSSAAAGLSRWRCTPAPRWCPSTALGRTPPSGAWAGQDALLREARRLRPVGTPPATGPTYSCFLLCSLLPTTSPLALEI